jgi:hypothetical protein
MPEVIAGLEIPETAAVAEATRLIQETTSPLIYRETTNGTVNSHVLERFIPGFQRTPTVEHFIPGFQRTTTVECIIGSPWPS